MPRWPYLHDKPVFPTKPYNNLRFYSEGGNATFKNVKVYKLGM